ncbi:hypothetical protein [Candidatus Palauibacter sp.]|uniref:hypothetical protein n=1 Tax=Candidatus Palauibacter sp. TaxID=3101350 RepID=UPI003B5AB718
MSPRVAGLSGRPEDVGAVVHNLIWIDDRLIVGTGLGFEFGRGSAFLALEPYLFPQRWNSGETASICGNRSPLQATPHGNAMLG